MKRRVSLIIAMLAIFTSTFCQEVTFTKFELKAFSKLISSDGWNLRFNFKNTSNKTINYLNVYYLAVNKVGDAESDKIRHVKKFMAQSTGPFSPGVSRKLVVECAVWNVNKQTAYPYQINITYSDGTEQEIQITNDNITKYFPCLTPIRVNDLKTILTSTEGTEEKRNIKNKFPENAFGDLEFSEVVICSMPKDSLYNNAKNWAVNTFYDFKDVLQYEDKNAGKLIIKGIYSPEVKQNILNKESETFWFTIIFDFKDNKYRYKVTNFISNVTSIINDKATTKNITPKERAAEAEKLFAEGKPNSISLANTQVDFYNMEYDYISKLIDKFKIAITISDNF